MNNIDWLFLLTVTDNNICLFRASCNCHRLVTCHLYALFLFTMFALSFLWFFILFLFNAPSPFPFEAILLICRIMPFHTSVCSPIIFMIKVILLIIIICYISFWLLSWPMLSLVRTWISFAVRLSWSLFRIFFILLSFLIFFIDQFICHSFNVSCYNCTYRSPPLFFNLLAL